MYTKKKWLEEVHSAVLSSTVKIVFLNIYSLHKKSRKNDIITILHIVGYKKSIFIAISWIYQFYHNITTLVYLDIYS